MKKVLAICLTMVLLVSLSVTAFAAPSSFVSSPSGNSGPGVVTVEPGDEGCTADVIITPFGDRFDLPEDLRTLFEKAYDELVNTDDLTKLVEGFTALIDDLGIKGKDLVVGDFFFAHAVGCNDHDYHKNCKLTLDADALNRFVGLVRMNKDGKWELVESAKVVNNSQELQFIFESDAPYAIVLDNSAGSLIAPQTGDYAMMGIVAMVAVLSAATLAFVVLNRKKTEA